MLGPALRAPLSGAGGRQGPTTAETRCRRRRRAWCARCTRGPGQSAAGSRSCRPVGSGGVRAVLRLDAVFRYRIREPRLSKERRLDRQITSELPSSAAGFRRTSTLFKATIPRADGDRGTYSRSPAIGRDRNGGGVISDANRKAIVIPSASFVGEETVVAPTVELTHE